MVIRSVFSYETSSAFDPSQFYQQTDSVMSDTAQSERQTLQDEFRNQEYKGRYTNLACIGDASILIRTLKLYADIGDTDELKEYFVESNPFGYSTRASRGRHFRSIRPLLLNTWNPSHEDLLTSVARADFRQEFMKRVLYLQVCLNSRLFREITLNVFREKLTQGILKLTKQAINDFIREEVPAAEEWTATTVDRLGSRYLTLMKMFGFVEGKDRERISVFSPSNTLLVYTIYLDQAIRDRNRLDFSGGVVQFLFVRNQEKMIERLKEQALDGYFDLQSAGSDIRISSLLEAEDLVDRLAG